MDDDVLCRELFVIVYSTHRLINKLCTNPTPFGRMWWDQEADGKEFVELRTYEWCNVFIICSVKTTEQMNHALNSRTRPCPRMTSPESAIHMTLIPAYFRQSSLLVLFLHAIQPVQFAHTHLTYYHPPHILSPTSHTITHLTYYNPPHIL